MRIRVVTLISVLFQSTLGLLFAPFASANVSNNVLISEIQVAGATSASEEFVELYNPSATDIALDGWTLDYHSATSANCDTGWTAKAKLASGTIKSHGFYLISSKDFLAGTADITATTAAGVPTTLGLASDGGNLRLTDASDSKQTVDAVAWGSGVCGEGAAAPAPGSGRSLERRPGADAETGGNAYDTNINQADFIVRTVPGPQNSAAPTEEPIDAADIETFTPAGETSGSSEAAAVELNELLPDPAAPLTDANDEFIEFFNPNSAPVDLAGYVIKTGASLATKHTLPSAVVPAGGYLALRSGSTKIALANAGSSVALFDPNGKQLGETITYPAAKSGQAWARFDDAWEWTTIPSPAAANVLSEPTVAGAATTSKSSKTTTAKATKAKAAAGAKTAKPKTTKASSIKSSPVLAAADTPTGHWLLFALAGITIAYVIYEFRYDLRNFYFRLRGYPGRGTTPGQTAQGRGSD
jgi:hypothetical protein